MHTDKKARVQQSATKISKLLKKKGNDVCMRQVKAAALTVPTRKTTHIKPSRQSTFSSPALLAKERPPKMVEGKGEELERKEPSLLLAS